ncbi:MAG: alpha-amylase, partial [Treponema sp.]|nr:alpha-amylase [Treponema sp.]
MKETLPKLSLILGSHAHVSYGADAEEFERVYANLLRPFIAGLYKRPRIKAALHYSGVLLHWVERAHNELFMLIEDMVTRRQVEMLGGGFYEPALPIIPQQDKIGQIEHLTTYLRKQFGKRPQGCWVPEYAWEQGLVSPLASCGMIFTFLGERQFALAGARRDEPSICEDHGKFIIVFPVSREIEAALAKKSISALLEERADERSGAGPISIFPGSGSVDGKVFPFEESQDCAWESFFEELSLCEHFVETISPGKLAKRLKGLRKAYIPDSSDEPEGMPARRFVITHPESARLYSKMFFTNMLVSQLKGDKARKHSAHEELWKAQGGALFNRSGRGGGHDGALRGAAYSAMLGAEHITRDEKFTPSLLNFDFFLDGDEQWLFIDSKINCYVQPVGGGVFELDYMPKAWN